MSSSSPYISWYNPCVFQPFFVSLFSRTRTHLFFFMEWSCSEHIIRWHYINSTIAKWNQWLPCNQHMEIDDILFSYSVTSVVISVWARRWMYFGSIVQFICFNLQLVLVYLNEKWKSTSNMTHYYLSELRQCQAKMLDSERISNEYMDEVTVEVVEPPQVKLESTTMHVSVCRVSYAICM